MKALSTLDRYVLGSWVRIFILTALGFPIVSILINLTDTLNRLLDRGLTMREIAWSYVYSIPENMFLVMPAAVLFATVFTVGTLFFLLVSTIAVARDLNHRGVQIGADNREVEACPLSRSGIAQQFLVQGGIVIFPMHEAVIVSHQARGDIARPQRGLDGKRAGTAHEIRQRRTAIPTRQM